MLITSHPGQEQGKGQKIAIYIIAILFLTLALASTASAKGRHSSSQQQTPIAPTRTNQADKSYIPSWAKPLPEKQWGTPVTSEYQGAQTLLASLSRAEDAESRLAKVEPDALEHALTPKDKIQLASEQMGQIQLGVNSLLDARDKLPLLNGSENHEMQLSVKALTDNYEALIKDHWDLISAYYSKLSGQQSPTNLNAQKKPPKQSTNSFQANRKAPGQNTEHPSRSIDEIQTEMGTYWDLVYQSELAIAQTFVHYSLNSKEPDLLFHIQERNDLISTIDSLFPETKGSSVIKRSKVAAGIVSIRNVLMEIQPRS